MAIWSRGAVAALVGIAAAASPARAASCIPGFDFAAFARTGIAFSGNGTTSSYDSSVGTYTATSSNTGGDIGTDATTAGAVTLAGNTAIRGTVTVGAGGNPATGITHSGGATYDATAALGATIPLPSVVVPSVGANQGSRSFSGGANALAPNQTYGAVACAGGPGTTLTLTAGSYVVSSLTVTGQCSLVVGSGPIIVYVTSGLGLAGGSVTNSTLRATSLVFLCGPAVASVTITGGSTASFAVYAPDAAVQITGNGDVYGAVVGKTVADAGNGTIHYDRALAAATAGSFACTPTEISRASPVIAMIGTQDAIVQGTFVPASGTQHRIDTPGDVTSFAFPYIRGHLRARTLASVTSTATTFSSGTLLFDAAGQLPPPAVAGCATFTGACRHLFTTTAMPGADGRALHPPLVSLDDTTAPVIGALIAPASAVPGIGPAQWQALVRAVLAAPLGGVDRSTVAVIPASPLAGSAARPTVAYVGATDGMLHAVCASTGGGCPALGTELWAFVPRVQLPLIRTNTARIDGSPHVLDVLDAGRWKTLLVFQTGFAIGTSPAVYALDITDPAQPSVLWEVATPAAPGAAELGTGLGVVAGTAVHGSQIANLVFVTTNNGGTGGPGLVVTALQQDTGARVWRFAFPYPSPPRGVAADAPVPATGIPARATTIDTTGQGLVTDLVVGDLYGDLWRLRAIDGASTTGLLPVFQFSTNKHPIGAPPAIYASGGRLVAAFASGGYDDPVATTWTASDQYVIAVTLSPAAPPVTEAMAPCARCDLAIEQALAPGDKGFAQALVIGTQLFVATDATDVSGQTYAGANTGHLTAIDLAGAAPPSTIVIGAGAGSIVAAGATLYGSSGQLQQRVGSTNGSVGVDVNLGSVAAAVRALWMRLE